jgi:hypothetical protein
MWLDLTVGVALGAIITTCCLLLLALAISPDNDQ